MKHIVEMQMHYLLYIFYAKHKICVNLHVQDCKNNLKISIFRLNLLTYFKEQTCVIL